MMEKPADRTVAGQVELALSRLDSLSILPAVAAKLYDKLFLGQSALPRLADIAGSDPAVTAKVFSLMHQQGIHLTQRNLSLAGALEELPFDILRDAFFSLKVCQPADGDEYRTDLRKQLTRHSLATACCAKQIAEIIAPALDPQLAYSAGLLHNIGILAMEDAMSRSFEAIRKQAQSTGAPLADIQQKHLGTDYIAIGKKLANKWRLPEPIALAIWLYTSNTAAVSETLPDAGIARVIQLADLVSAQSGIGIAENYQTLETPESIAESLGISSDQLEQIRQSLPEAVDERAQILGLDLPDPLGTYCQVLQKNVPQLVSSNSQLSAENKQLLSRSSHLDFATEFLLSLDSKSQPIDIAENFALRWQRFYQTSAVCLYLRPAGDSQVTEAIVVDDSSQCKAVLLHNPTLPELTSDSPLVFDSSECADWLFSQVPVDFDLSQTKLIPLVSNGRAVGAIVFELHYPADPEQIFKKLRATADIAAAVLDIALAAGNQQNLAEKFVRLLRYTTVPREVAAEPEKEDPLDSLAEMAAGAAHELNNPLSIISGRAQLLRESEDDPKKEKTLKAIQKNAGEIASIIDSLMSFAKPAEPRLTQTDLTQIIDEAKQLATHKISDEQTDFHIDLGKVEKSVTVDSAQIATSIANIFSNALESYDDGIGPIKVTAEEADGFIKIQISDSGCGMDEQTVKNAAYPFFSAKPAGRKRGIGLALAKRLINLNGGSLNIKSDPASGTNVTITLPC